tara:strand:+ start:550 stop:738 length:189 start_codon:yes stop_codon:yes gene_type:complete
LKRCHQCTQLNVQFFGHLHLLDCPKNQKQGTTRYKVQQRIFDFQVRGLEEFKKKREKELDGM